MKPSLKQLHFSSDPEVDGIFSSSNKKKKYKMRITSKGSGKKIDINFSFKKDIQTDLQDPLDDPLVAFEGNKGDTTQTVVIEALLKDLDPIDPND